MERKRVTVYKPGSPQIALYEPGGQVPTADQGGEAEMILQAYMQAQQMTEQEAQQFMQSFMQMQPEQQQAMLSQIAQQLMSQQGSDANQMTSPATPMARNGGDLLKAKKGLSKKIKGISADQNMTADNVVEKRAQTIMNSIGQKMMTNLLDEGYNMANAQTMNVDPYQASMSQMSAAGAPNDLFNYGGSYNYNYGPFYGGYEDPADNPMIQNFYGMQNNMKKAGQNFLGALGDLAEDTYVSGIKTKVRGPMFRDLREQDEMSMARNGGAPKFQPGGSYTSDEINMALDDLGITDEAYHQAIKEGRQDSNEVNRVNSYIDSLRRQRNIGTGSSKGNVQFSSDPGFGGKDPNGMICTEFGCFPSGSGSGTGSEYYTGDLGGFYVENGQIKYGQPGTQGGQGFPGGFSGGIPAASNMQQLLGTFGPGAIQRAFQMMTPEDVYMSKFKTSAGILGPRLVAKWKYKPDGSVERVGDMGDFSMFDDTEKNTRDAFGNLTTERRAMKSFQDPNYLRQMGRTPEESFSEDENGRGFANRFGKLVRGSGQPDSEKETERKIRREERRFDRNAQRYQRRTGQPYPTELPFNINAGELPQEILEPNQNLFEQKTQSMASGGRAGKLVMRNKYTPSLGGIGRFASPAMDFTSSIIEGAGVQENEGWYTPGNLVSTLRDAMPMAYGVHGIGPGLTGQEMANLQPGYAESQRFPQIPGEQISMASLYSGKTGGTFQYGGSYMDEYYNEDEGVYYLDEDEIQDIMKRGGQIEYL